MSLFKNNIVKVYSNIEPFWGRYSELNKIVSAPSLENIQNYQLQKIQEFQDLSLQKAETKYKSINDLFKSGDINTLLSKYEDKSVKSIDTAITNIVSLLNGTYGGNISKKKNDYDYNYLNSMLKQLSSEIGEINNALVKNGSQGIPSKFLDTIDMTMKSCGINSLNKNVISNWFEQLNHFKGELVEAIGTEWLATLKVPEIQTLALNTGALNLQGNLSEGRHRGQLIQDIMLFDITNIDLFEIPITYHLAGNKSQKNSTLGDLLQDMEKINRGNNKKQIVIDDEGYSTLLNLSALNIQAKAGINQKPWNENKSTSVTINEFADEATDIMELSAKRTFQLLHELDQNDIPEKDVWVKDTSKDYNLIADYGLATVLFKILHLQDSGNQYLLTPDGFTTYTDRIAKLIDKRKSYIYIKNKIEINDSTLNTEYRVGMKNYG